MNIVRMRHILATTGFGLSAFLFGIGNVSAQVTITPLVISPQLTNVNGVTTDGANLYITSTSADSTHGMVSSVPIGGGSVTQLYQYTGGGHGGEQVAATPAGITVLGSTLYWADPNSGPFTDPQIWTSPTNGSGPLTAIVTGSALGYPYGVEDFIGLTNDGHRLYESDAVGGIVNAVNKNGSSITQIGPNRYPFGFGPYEHINTIAQYNGTLYVADGGSGSNGLVAPQLVSIPTTGGTFTSLYVGAPFENLRGIAIGNNTIFLADQGSDTIWSLPLTGGNPTALVTDNRFLGMGELTFFDNALYLADAGNGVEGTIWKVDLSSASAVPEPGILALLASSALGALGLIVRKRRSKQTS